MPVRRDLVECYCRTGREYWRIFGDFVLGIVGGCFGVGVGDFSGNGDLRMAIRSPTVFWYENARHYKNLKFTIYYFYWSFTIYINIQVFLVGVEGSIDFRNYISLFNWATSFSNASIKLSLALASRSLSLTILSKCCRHSFIIFYKFVR